MKKRKTPDSWDEATQSISKTSEYINRTPSIPPLVELAKIIDEERRRLCRMMVLPKKALMGNLRGSNKKWDGVRYVRSLVGAFENTSEESTKKWTRINTILMGLGAQETIGYLSRVDPVLASKIQSRVKPFSEYRLLVRISDLIARIRTRTGLIDFFGNYERELSHSFVESSFNGELRQPIENSIAKAQNYDRRIMRKIEALKLGITTFSTQNLPLMSDPRKEVVTYFNHLQTKEVDEGELSSSLKESSKVKSFLNLKDILLRLDTIAQNIGRGMEEKDWKHFEDFYQNLDAEIDRFRSWGDIATANYFIRIREKYHEYPVAWLYFVGKIRRQKDRDRALSEAINEVKRTIQERYISISQRYIGDIKKILSPVYEAIQTKLKNLQSLRQQVIEDVEDRESVLFTEIKRFKTTFKRRNFDLMHLYHSHLKAMEFLKSQNLRKYQTTLSQLMERRGQWLSFSRRFADKTEHEDEMADANSISKIMFSTYRIEDIELYVDKIARKLAPFWVGVPENLMAAISSITDFSLRAAHLLESASKEGFTISLPENTSQILFSWIEWRGLTQGEVDAHGNRIAA